MIGPPLPRDRMCFGRALNNPVRRWVAPPRREVEALGVSEGETVADLGAGVGYFARELLRQLGPTGRLVLVDIDAENLEVARRLFENDPRVRLLVGSAAAVSDIGDGSVDRALMSLVLCCMVDKEGALAEVWRILRPGGRLLVTYPRGRFVSVRRGPSLRVSPPRWAKLVAQRPWLVEPVRRGRIVRRHLLSKPWPPAERCG